MDAYGEYYDDYSGNGLLEDVYGCITDDDALAAAGG